MDSLNINLVNAFNGVLDNLVDAESYADSPPRGPRELATLSEAEINALELNENGESLTKNQNYNSTTYKNIDINNEDGTSLEGSYLPKLVSLPTSDELDGIIICGIDGSNQRVEKNSFCFILGRAAIVNFKYTKGKEPPYFYTIKKDASAVTWVDGNIFKESVIEHTNNKLKKLKEDEGANVFEYIKQENPKPFLVTYDHLSSKKSPSSHALGWAVKFQQALELLCLAEIKTDANKKTVCIKDGPLFSTSSSKNDTVEGLRPVIQWNNQVLVCVSKRINDAKLILDTFGSFPELLQIYFPGDEVTRDSILSIGTDSLLLQRILKPGHRTPFIKAVPVARIGVCNQLKDDLNKDFTPLCCYYRGKTRPQTFIRIEIPFFMYENNKQLIEEAIAVVAWQHELGGKAPYIQLVADDLCQLNYEKELLEKQTLAALSNKKLELAEQY
ncbi:MAG TPA: DNA double-strand break repair nuclease NurA [Chitinophagaceae bacterium]|nr:DNA double-strand break repair nuclease NurA [Chitinophagaceae bacterium]HQV85940.1 DNA double-strand break repair nuclease NurA [Chitinophagaceae bacterium]